MDYRNMTRQQLEEEVANLKKELRKYDSYKQAKDAADEVKAIQMAFIDAGFSEDQAFQMILAVLPLATKMR